MRVIRLAERQGDFRDQIDAVLRRADWRNETLLILVPFSTSSGISSPGEYENAIISARSVARRFCSAGREATQIESKDLVVAKSMHGAWHLDEVETGKLIKAAADSFPPVAVMAVGFGRTVQKEIVRLAKGDEDLCACFFGTILGADETLLMTDSGGIPSADPTLVPEAFTIESIGYAEALEMTHFGARYMDPRAIPCAAASGLTVRLAGPGEIPQGGTRIEKNPRDPVYPVRGLASIPDISLLSLRGAGLPGVAGIAARMFGALGRADVNVILITQASSELSICCAIAPRDAERGSRALADEFSSEIDSGSIESPIVERDLCVLAIVGEQMKRRTGIAARVFSALGRNGVNIVAIAQGSSELNISVVTLRSDRAKALCALHDAFFLAGLRTVHLFLVGTGLVGSTLLSQIAGQKNHLERENAIRIKLAGIADSKRMLIDSEGIDLNRWRSSLERKGMKTDMDNFVGLMKMLNVPSACFCDCTASDSVPDFYRGILESAISVVTPNKRGNSGPRSRYAALKAVSRDRDVLYGYETTVGAGLPVIGTLRDLVACGDRIRKIEAVLSGTISYIFNGLGKGDSFSALVSRARQLGFTEPDPRDDLGAIDIARKTLILAREAGMEIEFDQITIEPLIPSELMASSDVDKFLDRLPEVDDYYRSRHARAASEGKTLRYVTLITEDKATLSLGTYGPESPFYNLSGTDNLVMFSTDRYCVNPLVVRGPGAGADVTAGGIFAEILKTAQSYL